MTTKDSAITTEYIPDPTLDAKLAKSEKALRDTRLAIHKADMAEMDADREELKAISKKYEDEAKKSKEMLLQRINEAEKEYERNK